MTDGRRDLAALPKVQSHLHLTGSMRPSTLRELAARYGVPEPAPTTWDGSTVQTWDAFQSRYDTARAVIRSAADVARVITEAAADDAGGGCGWLEVQVDPTSYAAALGGLEAAIEAVLAAPVTPPSQSAWSSPPVGRGRAAMPSDSRGWPRRTPTPG